MLGWLRGNRQRDTGGGAPELKELKRIYPALNASADKFLDSFGPSLTLTPDGHIETDIAGAASLAGSKVLRAAVSDLDRHPAGQVILAEVYDGQDALLRFMAGVAAGMELSADDSWDEPVSPDHKPLLEVPELVGKLQHPLRRAALQAKIPTQFHGHVAALTAMKLVAGGHLSGLLDQAIGRSLAAYYVIAGSKTVPPAFGPATV